MSQTSTIPAAVQTLAGYMQTVAQANPSLDCGVYVGEPIEEVTNNLLMVGHWETGALITEASYTWAGMPVYARTRYEEYELQGTIRTWSGNVDVDSRLAEAFTLSSALQEQIVSDPSGSGNLAGGAWGEFKLTMEHCGPLEGRG